MESFWRPSFSSWSCLEISFCFHKSTMGSIALYGDNSEIISASLHFKQQNSNYFLIVYLKAFPQEGQWFPKCDLLAGIGNVMNKQPDVGVLSSQVLTSQFTNKMYYRNSYMGPNQPLDWLVNCSESFNCTPMTNWCRLRQRGDLCQHFPDAVSFIPAFCYSSTEREAWDWICSVME